MKKETIPSREEEKARNNSGQSLRVGAKTEKARGHSIVDFVIVVRRVAGVVALVLVNCTTTYFIETGALSGWLAVVVRRQRTKWKE